MAKQATATKPRQDNRGPQAAQSAGQVAVILPPRLPFHPAVQERFGVDRAGWKVLCEAVFPAAKTPDSIILALSYCKARRLDPFKRNVHIVPIWNSQLGREVETVWPGVSEHRTTATRTGTYAGMDVPAFGPMVKRTFTGKVRVGRGQDAEWRDDEPAEVTFPEWCQVTLYRMVQGTRVPFPGPRVYWLEYYNRKNRQSEIPNEQWHRRPSYMLEKCAEAGALRRGFPEELGDEFTIEEAGFFGGMKAQAVDAEVVSTTTPSREPTRADFTEEQSAGAESEAPIYADHDPQTGEVRESGKPAAEPEKPAAEAKADEKAGEANPWFPPAAGQEAGTKAIIRLINEQAKSEADLEAIDKANAERIAKYTEANRATIWAARDAKLEALRTASQ